MIFRASAHSIGLWRRARFGLLVLAAMVLVHDAVYLVHHGADEHLAEAMSRGGHDQYWPMFTLLATIATLTLVAASVGRAAGLQRRLDRASGDLGPSFAAGEPVSSYRHELWRLWIRLMPIAVFAFTIQENGEHVLSVGAAPGLGVLGIAGGEGFPLALPVIAAVTLAIAAIGAVVRWRIAILVARVARLRSAVARHRIIPVDLPGAWPITAALCAHRWILVRTDSGRAPPLALRA